jgi:hypothetical protein
MLCRLLVVCNVAWWAVEHPYFRHFFKIWLPNASIPGRKQISGRILEEETGTALGEMCREVHGRYGTGQSDGWKNVTRSSILGSVVNVEGTVSPL